MNNENNDMRTYVASLLESSQERKRKVALLHYELEHPAYTSETEMISAMALGHGDGSNNSHTDGRISDKTFYIALNYQNRADKLNSDAKKEIVLQLVELEQIQERLEYYTSLLEKRQALVIRRKLVWRCGLSTKSRTRHWISWRRCISIQANSPDPVARAHYGHTGVTAKTQNIHSNGA